MDGCGCGGGPACLDRSKGVNVSERREATQALPYDAAGLTGISGAGDPTIRQGALAVDDAHQRVYAR